LSQPRRLSPFKQNGDQERRNNGEQEDERNKTVPAHPGGSLPASFWQITTLNGPRSVEGTIRRAQLFLRRKIIAT
jgi:hypothetical protein